MTRAILGALAVLVACAAPAKRVEMPPPVVVETKPAAPALPPVDEALIASEAALETPFLYLAEKDGRKVHVLGTVHLGIEPARLPASVWDALATSKILAVEADTRTMDLASFLRKDGTTLDAELGPEHWAKLEAALGRDMAAGIKKMKTSVAVVLLTARALPMTAPMDEVVRTRAEEAGAKVVFLEQGSFQEALLDKWLDVRTLRAMLDDLPGSDESQRRMLTTYARGDEAGLIALSNDRTAWASTGRSDAEFDQMNREILLDRNAAWIAPIEKLAGEADAVFVAVGAAHLFGEGGVLALLGARGWQVRRVP